MSRRATWFLLLVTFAFAGLAAGLLLAQSIGRLDPEQAQATLAPIAAIATATPTTASGPGEAGTLVASSTTASADPTLPPATETLVIPATETGAATVATVREHVVQEGETLTVIALLYGVSIESIAQANNRENPDFVLPGEVLLIPSVPGEVDVISSNDATSPATTVATGATPEEPSAVTVTPPVAPSATASQGEITGPADWPPSLTTGDLSGNYPLLAQTGSGAILLHYQPGTYPATNIDTLAPTFDQIFAQLQSQMNGTVPQQVDVYLGGTLFGINPSLQGFTQSYEFRSFVLINGAFHPGERDYILGHELAHVAATHILGPASSTMIHEGLATYLPQSYLTAGAGYLPLEEICAAAYRTNAFRSASQLNQLSYGATAFGGHIRTFFNYNLSGCFVGYLIETYGMQRLDQVYDTGNYSGVYGMNLGDLDAAWQSTLETVTLSVDAENFVAIVQEIADAYETYINASAGGYHANYEAYLHLNRARLEANRGDLQNARLQLDRYWSLLGY